MAHLGLFKLSERLSGFPRPAYRKRNRLLRNGKGKVCTFLRVQTQVWDLSYHKGGIHKTKLFGIVNKLSDYFFFLIVMWGMIATIPENILGKTYLSAQTMLCLPSRHAR